MSWYHAAALVSCVSQTVLGEAAREGHPGLARRLGLRLIIMIVLASVGLIAGAGALLIRSRRARKR